MSIHIHSEPSINRLPEAAKEFAENAVADARDIAKTAETATKDFCQATAARAGDTLATSKDYIRRNPMPVLIGAVAFGVALGYLLVSARRRPSFGDRYLDEPLGAVREAILGALAPVSERVHKGYDSAREGAGKVMGELHHMGAGRGDASLSDQIGRLGNNLKFW